MCSYLSSKIERDAGRKAVLIPRPSNPSLLRDIFSALKKVVIGTKECFTMCLSSLTTLSF
jgi:hypothetical protein